MVPTVDAPVTPAPEASTPGRSWWVRRPELTVVVLLLVVVGPLVQSLVANSAPRLAMTAAIVDDGTLAIDGYPLGLDFTTRGDHVYSDKAPLQSIVGVPAYAAARAVGAEPARVPRPDGNLTLWWVTLTTSVLPLAVGVVLMGRAVRRRGLTPTVGMLAAVTFGTLLLPLASSLYGHVPAAVLGFAAWGVLDRVPVPSWRRGAAAGALVGLAVATEYQMGLVAVVLGVWLLARRRLPAAVGLVLGALPAAALVMAVQRVTTGSALSSGYQTKEWEGESGFFSTHVTHPPDPAQMAEVLFGTRGLVLFTPIVAVGVVGLVLRWTRHRDDAGPVGLAVLAGFLLLQASWANTWGGEGPGARYVTPALPFLAVGVAEVWSALRPAVRGAVLGVSVLSMGLATATYHLMPEGARLVTWHLDVLRDDGPVPTLFTLGLGSWGWLVHAALVAAAVALLRRRRPEATASP